MAESLGRTILVIRGRVVEVPPSRADYRRDPRAWWKALSLLGGTLLGLGVSVGAGLGPLSAIGGVALFVAAAVVAGSERYEFATALGCAGIIWTSAGIAIYLGTDPSLGLTVLAFAAAGFAALAVGILGAFRARRPVPLSDGSG
jgi:hypothetical protein